MIWKQFNIVFIFDTCSGFNHHLKQLHISMLHQDHFIKTHQIKTKTQKLSITYIFIDGNSDYLKFAHCLFLFLKKFLLKLFVDLGRSLEGVAGSGQNGHCCGYVHSLSSLREKNNETKKKEQKQNK